MIEINRIAPDPLRIEGRVGREGWVFFHHRDHWAFYIADHVDGDHCHSVFALTARFPPQIPMARPLAIRIAWACARFYETTFPFGA